VIHRVKGFGVVKDAEVGIFLEFSCFSDDPMDNGNLICGSSAFSKSSLNTWKILVHILLKPNLENFRKIPTSASLTTPKPLTLWITTNCGKFLQRWKYQTT